MTRFFCMVSECWCPSVSRRCVYCALQHGPPFRTLVASCRQPLWANWPVDGSRPGHSRQGQPEWSDVRSMGMESGRQAEVLDVGSTRWVRCARESLRHLAGHARILVIWDSSSACGHVLH